MARPRYNNFIVENNKYYRVDKDGNKEQYDPIWGPAKRAMELQKDKFNDNRCIYCENIYMSLKDGKQHPVVRSGMCKNCEAIKKAIDVVPYINKSEALDDAFVPARQHVDISDEEIIEDLEEKGASQEMINNIIMVEEHNHPPIRIYPKDGPDFTTFSTGGKKETKGKLRVDLIPPEATKAMAEVYTMGAEKYGDKNWEQGIPFTKLRGAVGRHLLKWDLKDDIDDESGLNHLKHALVDLSMLVTFIERHRKDLDDR